MIASASRLLLLLIAVLLTSAASAALPYIVDGDGDLVSDEIDDCPYTHPGVQVDAKGCAINRDDADQDGVPDVDDDCPYSPPGAITDARGCSLDSDFDGVADGIDRCPHTALSRPVNAIGCASGESALAVAPRPQAATAAAVARATPAPDAIPAPAIAIIAAAPIPPAPIIAAAAVNPVVAIEAAQIAAESPELLINFDFNSSRLGAGDLSAIAGYAKIFLRAMKSNRASKLSLHAYADYRETDVASLAVQRMVVVRSALRQQGISAQRLIAENSIFKDGAAGSNRRAEAKLLP